MLRVQERFQTLEVDLSLKDNLPSVRGNNDQLRQVLFNILINAADAMPKGGTLSIRSKHEKQWVVIAIKDTGMGIAVEDLDKIYDPFFTTKSPDKGTGLGLSISLKIVEELGRRLKVRSELGKGTEFIMYLRAEARNAKNIS